MATARHFEDLRVRQEARTLVSEVYCRAKQAMFRRDFNLRDQMTRPSTATMSNVAEEFERGTKKESIQFLKIAKASNGQVRPRLYVALDQGYLDRRAFDELQKSSPSLSRRLAAFIH